MSAMDVKTGASPAQEPQQMVPRCQYCGADPAPLIPAFTQIGGGRLAVFICGNPGCRAIHTAQLVGLDQPKESPIVRP